MSVGPLEFARQSEIPPLDDVYWYSTSISVAAGAGANMPQAIRRQAVSVVFIGEGPLNIVLNGGGASAAQGNEVIGFQTGSVLKIGVELDSDVTPSIWNPGAGAVVVSMIVFRRRRRFERPPGQV